MLAIGIGKGVKVCFGLESDLLVVWPKRDLGWLGEGLGLEI